MDGAPGAPRPARLLVVRRRARAGSGARGGPLGRPRRSVSARNPRGAHALRAADATKKPQIAGMRSTRWPTPLESRPIFCRLAERYREEAVTAKAKRRIGFRR